jgi:hypothetical protein
MTLTGAYVDYIFHNQVHNKDMLWKRIYNADQHEYVLATAASSKNTGKEKSDLKDAGIIDAHAYSLIDTYPIITDDKRKVNLIKIRNPWGSDEWNGDWSDKDKKNWTEDLQRKLKFEDKDDGEFWIDFENFLKFYYNTTI